MNPTGKQMAGTGDTSAAARVVTNLLAALSAGRAEDVLALVDPNVTWEPATRPARSFYQGHTETASLLADLRAAYGPYRIEIDTLSTETPHAARTGTQITARTHVVPETADGDQPMPAIISTFTLHNGLVTAWKASLPPPA